MIELNQGKMINVGPRSAHIANLGYEVYADPGDVENPVLKAVRPRTGDPEYASIECSNGRTFALTLSGAANIAGYVKSGDYALGNREAALKAWEPLARNMGLSVEETAKKALALSAEKNGKVVRSLIKDYELDQETLVFVGGGGGAATVVPHIAELFRCRSRIARNAQVISPIGVALAMVRDMVERTISNPTEEEILAIRREALRRAVQSGAKPETVEVRVEVDTQRQKVRAVATGATELRTRELKDRRKSDGELLALAAENLKVEPERLCIEADNGLICAVTCETTIKHFVFLRKKVKRLRLIDREGVIRLQKKNAEVASCMPDQWRKTLNGLLEEFTFYADGGAEIPNIYVVLGAKIIDLAGMQSASQIMTLCEVELAGMGKDERLIMVCTATAENGRA
jgi:hypothetical protein